MERVAHWLLKDTAFNLACILAVLCAVSVVAIIVGGVTGHLS